MNSASSYTIKLSVAVLTAGSGGFCRRFRRLRLRRSPGTQRQEAFRLFVPQGTFSFLRTPLFVPTCRNEDAGLNRGLD